MSDHPIYRLGDVAEVVAGNPAPQDPSAFSLDGPLFVRMQDVGRNHHDPFLSDSADRLSSEWLSRNRLRLFRAGSTLIPKSGASVNLNHRAKLATDAYVVSHLAVVTPDRARLDPEYLFWWSVQYDPRTQAQVTSLPSLRLSVLKQALLALPPLDEQRRIVAILNRAAKIERLRARAAERLREFVPALFVRMFGGADQIDKRFACRPLRDVSEISGGATKGRKIPPEDSVHVPYLRVANVQDGFLDLAEVKTIAIRRAEEGKYALAVGDLVMTEGGDLDKLGRAAIWNGELEYCAHQNHVFRVRPDRNVVLTDYLRDLAGSEYGKAYFLSVAKRTTGIASINKTQLGGLPVPLAPIELQMRYERVADKARGALMRADVAAAGAAALSGSMMSMLLATSR